ncbi:hypothetical protein GOP47_0009940 [Adiantum capillus-veneris]|uniref:Myb/SANT-like DNA-binding domain-containing protein n=1 Tax=Adiantum capillus-veneris TaxID=13818 RepID=A0A9D4ZHP7_ADICA|nr:hypothetical protein GOP47_0009940 [Adiantum capillus-veneris]
MDPSQHLESQKNVDDNASQNVFSQPSYYSFTPPPFTMPPHGFTAMLASPSPSSPFLFKPSPPPCAPPLRHKPMHVESGPSPNDSSHQSTKGCTKPSTKKALHLGGEDVQEIAPTAPSKKARVSKKKGIVELEADKDIIQKSKDQWKDIWVDQLIHVREGMHEEFNNPQKQGINLWAKVVARLASTYHDFDKDSEACRKKWGFVLGQYRLDKAHNATSGNDRKYTCKWYDVVDEYYHDRASVKCVSRASSTTHENTKMSEVPGEEDSKASQIKIQATTTTNGKRSTPKVEESLAQMADTGRALLDHLKDNSNRQEALENKHLDLLVSFHDTMAGFLKHVNNDNN